MRTIKFRAWDKKEKYMSVAFTLQDASYEGFPRPFTDDNGECDTRAEYEVMQFTGLLDKNGKEIYEGDIVKVLDRDWTDAEKDTRTLIVYFHHGMFELISKEGIEELESDSPDIYNHKWITAKIYREYGRDKFEVIGNIYEQSHLLDNTDTKV